MVKRILLDPTQCIGCRVCEAVCSLVNEGEFNPEKSRIRLIRTFENEILHRMSVFCLQCEEPYCQAICPASAIFRDERNVVMVDEKKCIGCKMCEIVCPAGAITVRFDRKVAVKCMLCPQYEEPQCAKYCYGGALQYIPAERAGIVRTRKRSLKFQELMNQGD